MSAAASLLYRPRTIKRDRRTKARIDLLDNQIIGFVAEDHPTSVRHIFYRCVDPTVPEPVEKSNQTGYRHFQDRLVKLRRSGRIPYGCITDATRYGYHTQTYRDQAEFLRSMKSLYRADLWELSEYYCEVWCESRSIAGTIVDTCRELAVSLYPAGGFASLSLTYMAAEVINQNSRGRPVVIFYVGDYDTAGVLIDASIERELRQHLPADIQLEFIRLGITSDQIKRYNLPTRPRKDGDRRSLHIHEVVEAEAMPPHILRNILRRNIESLLPEAALQVAEVEEKSARDFFDRMADIMGEAA